MKGILHIANGFSINRLYDEMIRRLHMGSRHQVVIAPTFKTITCEEYPYQVHQYIRKQSLFDRIRFKKKIDNIWKFTKINTRDLENIGLIHAHTLFSDGAVAYKAYHEYGIPYIVAVRNTDINTFFKYCIHLRSLGLAILQHAQKIILLSPVYEKRLISIVSPTVYESLKDKIEVIPNGINSFWIGNVLRCTRPLNKPVKLIYCGRMDANKNIIRIIEASKIVNQTYPVNLQLIGNKTGDNRRYIRKIKRQIEECDFKVELIDSMSHECLIQYYRNGDIFVMPSHTETFGLVYAEALSQGLPIIYTHNEGFDGYYLDGKVGYAVDSHSTEDIAEKIISICKNYEEVTSAIATVDMSAFSWDKIAERYEHIYDKILIGL